MKKLAISFALALAATTVLLGALSAAKAHGDAVSHVAFDLVAFTHQ
jgi:hypothetical protein